MNSTGFIARLHEQHEKMGEFKDDFYIFGFVLFIFCIGTWKGGVAIYEMQKTGKRQNLGFSGVEDGNQEFSFSHKFKWKRLQVEALNGQLDKQLREGGSFPLFIMSLVYKGEIQAGEMK